MFGSNLARCFKMGLQSEGEKGWKQDFTDISGPVLTGKYRCPYFLINFGKPNDHFHYISFSFILMRHCYLSKIYFIVCYTELAKRGRI